MSTSAAAKTAAVKRQAGRSIKRSASTTAISSTSAALRITMMLIVVMTLVSAAADQGSEHATDKLTAELRAHGAGRALRQRFYDAVAATAARSSS